jgi:hypothetical protein
VIVCDENGDNIILGYMIVTMPTRPQDWNKEGAPKWYKLESPPEAVVAANANAGADAQTKKKKGGFFAKKPKAAAVNGPKASRRGSIEAVSIQGALKVGVSYGGTCPDKSEAEAPMVTGGGGGRFPLTAKQREEKQQQLQAQGKGPDAAAAYAMVYLPVPGGDLNGIKSRSGKFSRVNDAWLPAT